MNVSNITKSFYKDFYSLVQQIPYGKITTYGALAKALGDIRAARTVGKMLNENPRPIIVPCHRVVMSDGSVGGFGMGIQKKRELLKDEGISLDDDRIVDFEKKLFADFITDKPLEGLREEQFRLASRVKLKDDIGTIKTVGGLDVAYLDNLGFASTSFWEGSEEKYTHTVKSDVTFPYIPTYLSFREMPLLLELLEEIEQKPDILMVDGNGIMHPIGLGLASHLGVEMDIPTIGVAKSLLCGKLEHDISHGEPVSRVLLDDDIIGYALLSSKRAKNPIYISPGHCISSESALEITKKYCQYKIPNPIRGAHMKANELRNQEKEKK